MVLFSLFIDLPSLSLDFIYLFIYFGWALLGRFYCIDNNDLYYCYCIGSSNTNVFSFVHIIECSLLDDSTLVQLLEKYSNVWHHGRVRRYLTSDDWPGPESKGKPWYGLLMLLRKYPEHFVINTRSKGRVTLEFVSLVSLLS